MNLPPISIAGAGAVTSLGLTLPSSAAALFSGLSSFSEHPLMFDKRGEHPVVARVPYPDETSSNPARLTELIKPAIREALASLAKVSSATLGVVVAAPVERPGLAPLGEQEIRDMLFGTFREKLRITSIEIITGDHSSGVSAIACGYQALASGQLDFCLAGGADSFLMPETLKRLDVQDKIRGTTNLWGTIPGEGAGFCLLASANAVRRHGLATMGSMLAVAMTQDDPCDIPGRIHMGKGLSAAVDSALASLDANDRIDQTICDLTGEIWRADDLGFTMTRFQERFQDVSRITAPVSAWGDTGVASALLSVGLAIHAGRSGYAEGPRTLVCSSSASGERGALLLHIPAKERI